MTRTAELDLAEDVALVTFSMLNALDHYDEAHLPNGYRFDLFEGFPGFCDHAGAAGLALHRAFHPLDRDCWLDIVASFAAEVLRYAVTHSVSADREQLARLVDAARQRAVADGLAFEREARS